MKKMVAIIPARGGSKRIPRKNIKHFMGEPIISYPIKELIRSEMFDKVYVSTDDPEIASIAEFYGAIVPKMRDMDLADDYISTVKVIGTEIMNFDLHQSKDLKKYGVPILHYYTLGRPLIVANVVKELV